MHLRSQLFYFLTALTVGGCSSTVAGDPGSSSGPGGASGGASANEIGGCKRSCDKMKFFRCSSADEQARCYQDCDKASSSQIDVFTGCAENSICDPQCRTTIQPKAPEGGGGAGGAGGGGASASTCASACDKLVTCSKIPLGAKNECATQCAAKGYQYQIDCVNETACAQLESTCGGTSSSEGGGGGGASSSGGSAGGGTTDTTSACLSECDSINFFKCAPVAAHAACRDECASATSTRRDAFTSCSKSSGVDCERKSGCLEAFLE